MENFSVRGGKYTNNGQYGIFPVLSSQGRVELNEVSGSNDTGLYTGQSSDVTMTNNIATNNSIGLEVENSTHVTVQGNSASGNTTGILVDVLPGLVVAATSHAVVAGNILYRNNRPNPDTDPSDLLSHLPSGIGILNVGGDQVVVSNNLVLENNTVGIAVIQLPTAFASLDPRVEPFPDFNQVRGNVALGNGRVRPRIHCPWLEPTWLGTARGKTIAGRATSLERPYRPLCRRAGDICALASMPRGLVAEISGDTLWRLA